MRSPGKWIGLALLALLWCAPHALAAEEAAAAKKELTVGEIVSKTNRVAYYQGRDGRAKAHMTITDSQGRVRSREFVILRRDVQPKDDTSDTVCKDQMFYVYFRRPADVNKMVFMVHKHVDKDDDRWLYLPALDLIKRIASTDKRTSFAGSDFFYEDVSGRNINDDKHELTDTTNDYYILKNTPKDPDAVEFSYFVMYIMRSNFVPRMIIYFDKKGEKHRVYTAEKLETIDGFPTVTQAKMEDLRSKSVTQMQYTSVKYNIGLPDNIFTERYMRKAPRKHLR